MTTTTTTRAMIRHLKMGNEPNLLLKGALELTEILVRVSDKLRQSGRTRSPQDS